MPRWKPEPVWEGRDVFIIGGGDSLRVNMIENKFNWDLLHSECTIGCNDAYSLGVNVCKVCIFGDYKWFLKHERLLELYQGTVFTNCSQLQKSRISWVWLLERYHDGVHVDGLGWNDNTGASAVNLALLLGASRVFLLGFDMKLSKDGQNNWHPNNIDKPNKDSFPKFLEGFRKVQKSMNIKFPDVKVFNITDDSDLDLYPKLPVEDFWRERKSA
jgi:hypothetical protein